MHTQAQNPSIGAIGVAYADQVNDRTKGFFTEVHNSIEAVRGHLQRALEAPWFGSRETYRILADRSVREADLKELMVFYGERQLHCEAVIPVCNHDTVAHIAYYACNATDRRNSPAITSQEEMLLCAVVSRDRKRGKHEPNGYSVQLSMPTAITLDEADIRQLAEIYHKTFTSYLTELNMGAVWGMVEGNVVAVVRVDNKKIVAVAMAEVAEISLQGTAPLRIAEISEVSTHPEHQRRGLSRLAFSAVMDQLRRDNIHVVFSETRANHFAMMAVAYDCGLSPRGWLVQHCLIASCFSEVAQETKFGDLMVFSL